jgi:hypothetical protein
MAIIVSHTALITDSAVSQDKITYESLWDTLLKKAEYPIDYVPDITDCRVVERYPDGFLRESVLFGKEIVRERVTPRRDRWRIDFEFIDDPRMAAVVNELDQDREGRFRYTISLELTEYSAKRIREVSELFDEIDAGVLETARLTAETLRQVTSGDSAAV